MKEEKNAAKDQYLNECFAQVEKVTRKIRNETLKQDNNGMYMDYINAESEGIEKQRQECHAHFSTYYFANLIETCDDL